MTVRPAISTLALAVAAGWSLPAHAQAADAAAIQQELAAMRAQMQAMAQRIDTLEGQLAEARTRADAAAAQVAAIPQPAAPTVSAKPQTEIAWDGAPKLSASGGWSFKPRGRMQLDVAGVDAPDSIVARQKLGVATRFRRAYIGFDGTMPGGFGYRVEADLAGSGVELTDVYLTYKASPQVTITAGHHKPFQSMEDMTSDLFTSFLERAAFNSAFGFERRVGLSATYTGKQVMVQAGVFADDAKNLTTDSNNSYSIDGRVVFMPKLGSSQLHLGASAHYRDFNDWPNIASYSARPFTRTTDLKLVSTPNIPASGERHFGLEGAWISGRFHATAESAWMTALRPGLSNPTFNGGYAEVGYMLTDDVTAYKNGAYDRLRPKNPVGKGGLGALQVNLRYDWLDLNDAGVVGGRQQVAGVSLVWVPTDYTRFLVNYGHLWLDDAFVPAGTARSYSADTLGLRAQFDF